MYEYKIKRIVKVVDGDTVDVELDLGFGVAFVHRFRLWGCDAPELRGETLEKGREVKSFVDHWLNTNLADKTLILASTKFSGQKADKYGRYIADIYYWQDGIRFTLSDELVETERAQPYMDDGFYSGAPNASY